MIHLDHSRVKIPESLIGLGQKELKEAEGYYREAQNRNLPERFEFRAFSRPDVREALLELSSGKCAFCESTAGVTSPVEIEHFRPKYIAINLDGSVTKPAYWWLTNEWTNLYPICAVCNHTKANRFPVLGERVRFGSETSLERALVLDPGFDEPEQHLVFREDGFVASLPERVKQEAERYEGVDRGAITIDLFGLNRASLVDQRRLVAHSFLLELTARFRQQTKATSDFNELTKEWLNPKHAHLALRKQLLAKYINNRFGLESFQQVEQAALETDQTIHIVSDKNHTQAFKKLEKDVEKHKSFSVENMQRKDLYRKTANIVRVEIRNFKPIENLEFEMGKGGPERTGWKVLLGENAVGKSSILQAVSLVLMGRRRMNGLKDVDTSSLLRYGTRQGYVRVYLATEAEPLELRLSPKGVEYNQPEIGLQTIMLGFGSARWLPRRGSLPPETSRYMRLRNLYNPFVPLTDAVAWLHKLRRNKQHDQFSQAEDVILRLFQLETGTRLRFYKNQLILQTPGQKQSASPPLEHLSDGYQTVLAMAVSIMDLMSTRWEDMQVAEGIVLLDEIGEHLHPRWKLRIVSCLRAAFPRLQFLVTTHDPLCLRGLFDSEILVMHRRGRELIVFDDLPSPDALSVDQLLTSKMFGMLTTLDMQTERNFQEYYTLLAKPEPLRSQEESARLASLRETLDGKGMLGQTPREQLYYELADEYLAQTQQNPDQDRQLQLKEETKKKVKDLWERIQVG